MNPQPEPATARISEIFSSLQGEGLLAGQRHLFIRFEGCPIHCQYCDEWEKIGESKTVAEIVEEVRRLERNEGPHAYISLTGGEPLLQANFLKVLMPALKREGFRLYLETNGILWRELESVADDCDWICMDLKPSSVTGARSFLEEHTRFMSAAKKRKLMIKAVLSDQVDLEEFDELLERTAQNAPDAVLVIQPVTLEGQTLVTNSFMEMCQRRALKIIKDVRIIPQLHKLAGIR